MKKNAFNISKSESNILIFSFWVIHLYGFLLYAWITEDAYINFKVISNFLTGNGLVWNVGERVQVFTSPLWVMLTTVATSIAGESFYSTIVLSYSLTLSVFLLLWWRVEKSVVLFVWMVAILLSSRAFVDYSSSGLETPLIAFGVSGFLYVWCNQSGNEYKLFSLVALASMCAITRHDTVIITFPFVLFSIFETLANKGSMELKEGFASILFGLAPLLIWSAFSLIYFGLLVPNTAYSKIVNTSSQLNLFGQAINYLRFIQQFDPASLFIPLLALLFAFIFKTRHRYPLLLALCLFLLYLMRIGGDYMSSRFFVAPVCMSVLVVADIVKTLMAKHCVAIDRGYSVLLAVLPLAWMGVGLLKGDNPSYYSGFRIIDGIVDERAFYFGHTDLLTVSATGLKHDFEEAGQKIHSTINVDSEIVIACNVGMLGYYAGIQTIIVDPLAITDPFLTRLPLREGSQRIGHFERIIPKDYLLSLLTHSNQFHSPILKRYYDDILLATRASLLTQGRWEAIWRLNTGYYNKLIREMPISDYGEIVTADGKLDFNMHTCLGSSFLIATAFIVDLPRLQSGKLLVVAPKKYN